MEIFQKDINDLLVSTKDGLFITHFKCLDRSWRINF